MVKHQHKIQKAIVDDHDYSKVFAEPKANRSKARYKKPQNIKAQFHYIRRLIQTKRYNDARYYLLKIEHPKAQQWLEKLNKVDPDYSETTIILLKPLLLILILICLGMGFLVYVGQLDGSVAIGVGIMLSFFFLLLLSVWSRHQ